jgi:xylan 1,4-beta-xylosidase
VVAANGRYYLVNSSFAYFPALPVFESVDLVHWRQIGNVVEHDTQLDFDGLGISRGMFAPAIAHHDGMFYVVGTAVDRGGTFVASARDPAGPWSPLRWLPQVGGIDPSLFFDDDGRAWLVHNDAPAGSPRYDGHRAIWLQPLDAHTLQPQGARRLLLDGGTHPQRKPIWIEGPHLFRRDGWYYLTAAEGGTGPQHSQVVLRSRAVTGPYAPAPRNPILSQRDLHADRPLPVTNAGHADLVEAPDGRWWALFLASRPYRGDHDASGRETFLLPVDWHDGWPSILAAGQAVPYVAAGPANLLPDATQAPLSGNFTWHDDFDAPLLRRDWLSLRRSPQRWADLRARPGRLALLAAPEGLETLHTPTFLARRLQHQRYTASTALVVPPAGVAAGLAAFQNERYWYFLGARRVGPELELFLQRCAGDAPPRVLASRRIALPQRALTLQLHGDGAALAFGFDAGAGWQWLARDQDADVLSTATAGGFVGAMVGPYARTERMP